MNDVTRREPLDPELAAIVSAMRAANVPPPFSGAPEQARERMRKSILAARERTQLPVIGEVEDLTAESEGNRVPVRVYRPRNERGGLPTVIFFHGGGFVLGSVELMDDIARKLCRDINAVVVSVDYRLAPEHPFPAAHEDALIATRWAVRNAAMLGGDASRVAVAGESAGANLATSAALSLRACGVRLAAQLLIVPGVDMARDVAPIAAKGVDFPMLSPSDLQDISRLYMGALADRSTQFPPSPLRAVDLHGMPATLIAVAGHDPLQDEGIAYAQRLKASNVPVQLLRFEDMFHPFFGFFAASHAANRANDTICHTFSLWLEQHALPRDQ